ncbi:MAG: leucyl aminopeptidase [Pseudomonadota bacterium]
MEFLIKSGTPEKQRTACVIAGIFETRRLSNAAQKIDEASGGFVANLLKRGDLEGKVGQTLLLHSVPNVVSDRVLLVGCGKERELTETIYRKLITKTINALQDTGAGEAVCFLTELNVKGLDLAWNIRQTVLTVNDVLYRFEQTKSKKDPQRHNLRRLILTAPGRREVLEGEDIVKEATAISTGVNLARDLGNLPGNICTPAYLAEQAIQIGIRHPAIKVTVLDADDAEVRNMGAFLSVSSGSRQPPKFITMEYYGDAPDAAPYVLVGKGLTFDAGGISLKQPGGMDEMKFDMCGGAAVLATLQIAATLALPLNVIGVVPASENLPDGNANKPGDVVTSLAGLTIEILNTDAEGRLILCDALTYVERYKPKVVIDIATLTGACVVALGKHASGLLSNHASLAHDILTAGKDSGDRAWELPLWEEYQDGLKSNFADLANVAGHREAGAIMGACFLAHFTKKYHWAHLDIAGTAWLGGGDKGSTGRPVPLLARYLLDRVAAKSRVKA